MGRFQDAPAEAREMVARMGRASSVDEAEDIANQIRAKGYFGKDPDDPKAKMIWGKIQDAIAMSRSAEAHLNKTAGRISDLFGKAKSVLQAPKQNRLFQEQVAKIQARPGKGTDPKDVMQLVQLKTLHGKGKLRGNELERMERGPTAEMLGWAKKADEETGGRKDVPLSAVMRFLKHNPRLSDERFHEWTERKGFHTPSAESKAYNLASKASEVMTGGKSKGKMPKGVPPEDVRAGIKIEHEHTGSKEMARKVVGDHTTEFKHYYDKKKGLPAFEEQLKKAFFDGFIDEIDKIACPRTEALKRKRLGELSLAKMKR